VKHLLGESMIPLCATVRERTFGQHDMAFHWMQGLILVALRMSCHVVE